MIRGKAEYWFEIWQRGIVVAEGAGPVLEDVGREIVRYAVQYVQDGPIEIRGSQALRPDRSGGATVTRVQYTRASK